MIPWSEQNPAFPLLQLAGIYAGNGAQIRQIGKRLMLPAFHDGLHRIIADSECPLQLLCRGTVHVHDCQILKEISGYACELLVGSGGAALRHVRKYIVPAAPGSWFIHEDVNG